MEHTSKADQIGAEVHKDSSIAGSEPLPVIGVKTYKPDKYSRYIDKIFYLPGETSPHKVIEEGIFLNQQLFDNGLAKLSKLS